MNTTTNGDEDWPQPPPPPEPRPPVHVHDYLPYPRKDYGHGIRGDGYIYCRTCGDKKWLTS